NGDGVASIVGLTTAGKTYLTHSPGETWRAFSLTGNTADVYRDISHGRNDVYALMADGTMLWMSFEGGFGGLPALPNNLSVIALGGRYAMSNAGLTNGSYPCTAPKNAAGNYNCAGAAQRLYRLEDNRIWIPVLSSPMNAVAEPT